MSFETDLIKQQTYLLTFARNLTKNHDKAQDLTQDAYFLALKHRDKFTEGTNLRAWLCTILRNKFYDDIRNNWRIVNDSEGHFTEGMISVPEQEFKIEFKEFVEAFNKLGERQREALNLVAVEGHGYEEAAEIARASTGTIKSRLSRARAILARKLGAVSNDNITTAVRINNDHQRYRNC